CARRSPFPLVSVYAPPSAFAAAPPGAQHLPVLAPLLSARPRERACLPARLSMPSLSPAPGRPPYLAAQPQPAGAPLPHRPCAWPLPHCAGAPSGPEARQGAGAQLRPLPAPPRVWLLLLRADAARQRRLAPCAISCTLRRPAFDSRLGRGCLRAARRDA